MHPLTPPQTLSENREGVLVKQANHFDQQSFLCSDLSFKEELSYCKGWRTEKKAWTLVTQLSIDIGKEDAACGPETQRKSSFRLDEPGVDSVAPKTGVNVLKGSVADMAYPKSNANKHG
ncbi:hypothetical protein EHS25_001956 [Saitozyma podzolica]|uniref:Uncharacterized protein n=1 Tax=Saitozyma podzolica TaxID=1890683 RepID=A0A427YFY5_9TREE|nr:hypothetical protein EHS25_001956 [Saitozyma podzolica]